MLLWETLSKPIQDSRNDSTGRVALPRRTRRLPYETRCIALTKAGLRCRGRIRKGSEFCLFHDPEILAKRRRRSAENGTRRHRLSRLPDGYLRKLTNRAAVGDAMDRLYREVRLGIITLEMGAVLFSVLTRLMDSGLIEAGKCPQRSKVGRLRPKLSAVLTRKERSAWRRAVGNAVPSSPTAAKTSAKHSHPEPAEGGSFKQRSQEDQPATLPLQAAS